MQGILPEYNFYFMEKLKVIKEQLNRGEVEEALVALDTYLRDEDAPSRDEAYYLTGNAYRKKGDWQQALNNYQLAIEINPESPAVEARKTAIDILDFYHKDMYNQ